ncbi:hypothetical protein DP145_01650 [Clostridium tetani]|uniref:hypothetical protein n=1 Tax=Clostridium tetani TaxID=1513 RepID=UPI00100C3542|nr:hypothetical protein [Clostridium tetani]RXI46070.1 hypothetical protein DP126_07730 [Clostridium tetani]RXM61462.1 hypothetical protein DP138_04565 [Clostridium tetani]RXM70287.1 hypothetical protein DP145_01650 [Clostridium tetani]
MIDKETFRKTEGRIYRYYKQIKLIKNLNDKIILLRKQKKQIEEEKVELTNLNIDTELNIGIDYSREKIQANSDKCGQAEKATIKYIDNLEKELQYVVKQILKTNIKIRELELQVQYMEFNLSMLNGEGKIFIEWKYNHNKSIDWIAVKMYAGARSTAYRKREELVKDIAQWCNIMK